MNLLSRILYRLFALAGVAWKMETIPWQLILAEYSRENSRWPVSTLICRFVKIISATLIRNTENSPSSSYNFITTFGILNRRTNDPQCSKNICREKYASARESILKVSIPKRIRAA